MSLNTIKLRVDDVFAHQIVDEIGRCIVQECQLKITYVNFHSMNTIHSNPELANLFKNFDIVLPDGIALRTARKIMNCNVGNHTVWRHFEGWSDLLYAEAIKKKWEIFLLGGVPRKAKDSAKNLAQMYPGINISGEHHGYFSIGEKSEDIIDRINKSGTKILLVGMGQPLQEEFIILNRHNINVNIVIAVGGYFDKTCNRALAYPDWVTGTNLFWLYRLFKEPRRLWKRYSIGLIAFGIRCLSSKTEISSK